MRTGQAADAATVQKQKVNGRVAEFAHGIPSQGGGIAKQLSKKKAAGEGAKGNNSCWENQVHIEICLSLPIEAIAVRNLSMVS